MRGLPTAINLATRDRKTATSRIHNPYSEASPQPRKRRGNSGAQENLEKHFDHETAYEQPLPLTKGFQVTVTHHDQLLLDDLAAWMESLFGIMVLVWSLGMASS